MTKIRGVGSALFNFPHLFVESASLTPLFYGLKGKGHTFRHVIYM